MIFKISFGKIYIFTIICIHLALLVYGAYVHFPTRNEVAHIPAGLLCWHTGKCDIYQVNPPLSRMMASLPLLFDQPNMTGIRPEKMLPGERPEWEVAKRFANANSLDYLRLIFLARLVGILWSLLGAWIIYRWASEFYGSTGGYFSLTIWCFDPNILAHAQLATPDFPATVMGITASYVFWRYLRKGTWPLAFGSGLLLGLALLTKFTLLIFFFVWPLLWLIHRWDTTNQGLRKLPFRVQLIQIMVLFSFSILVINIGYDFDQTCKTLGSYEFVSQKFRGSQAVESSVYPEVIVGNRFRGTWFGDLPMPLPANYLFGIDLQGKDFEAKMPSYLRGEWRDRGWWYYYLYCLGVKVPLSTLLFVFVALLLRFFRHSANRGWIDELSLLIPALTILTLVSFQTGLNHHLRYVLPIYPFFVIYIGKLIYFLKSTWSNSFVITLGLLLWSIYSSLSIYPHSLSYFNELAGGPDKGWKHLVNSNIDWGQDLLFLKTWIDEHPEADPVEVAYHNVIDYRVIGIEYSLPPRDPRNEVSPKLSEEEPSRIGPYPGFFAIDIYNLLRGPYRYFQKFQPITKAGYSIFIYHITEEEANRVRKEMGLPPLSR